MAPPQTPEPSHEEVLYLRGTVLETLAEKGVIDTLDPRDLKRFKTDDIYVGKFLRNHDNEHKLAHEMAVDTLQWRKTFGTNDLTEEDCDAKLLEKGTLCLYNADKDGCRLLLFSVRNHIRGGNQEKLKKTLVYFLERFEREGGEKMTVFFDMQDTGIKNMDMEFIQYMINVFKFYYPFLLNYILVFEMPWILNALWKVIKTWLPPKSLEIIKFIDKKSIGTYVSTDQCLTSWGGTHTFNYMFVPEKKEVDVAPETKEMSATLVNGDLENKKVHFAESNVVSQAPKLKLFPKMGTFTSGGISLDVDPPEELMFKTNRVGSLSSIFLTNRSTSSIAFKIKTTSPDKYRVKPSIGFMESESRLEVMVTQIDQQAPSSLVRDKFLIMAVLLPGGMPSDGLDQVFKNTSKEDTFEMRLRVGMTAPEPETPTANHVNAASTPPPVSPMLINKLEQLLSKQSNLEDQFRSAKRFMYLTLIVMVAILCILLFVTINWSSNLAAHYQALLSSVELTSKFQRGANSEL